MDKQTYFFPNCFSFSSEILSELAFLKYTESHMLVGVM